MNNNYNYILQFRQNQSSSQRLVFHPSTHKVLHTRNSTAIMHRLALDRPTHGKWLGTTISFGSYTDRALELFYENVNALEWLELRNLEVLFPSTDHYDLLSGICARSGFENDTSVDVFDVFDEIHSIARYGWPGYVDARLQLLKRAKFVRQVQFSVAAFSIVTIPLWVIAVAHFWD